MYGFLFGDLDKVKDAEVYRKYLKVQQRRWHPDKFLQHCGDRIAEEDRGKILKQVKEISQELNQLVTAGSK